jgi:hypothetical protein
MTILDLRRYRVYGSQYEDRRFRSSEIGTYSFVGSYHHCGGTAVSISREEPEAEDGSNTCLPTNYTPRSPECHNVDVAVRT